ncbi:MULTISPECIES: ParA family protein [unclassified Sphingopyxis]|uniref:ParA family protein n=1 Tax=unclassified Sphingopyxis TaxID=2614943 RepID=UPI0007313C08|nr:MULTISPECIES: ParA family protein [unclassified Sphingopyxis]KTE22284.1 chromosome partitioning protein ParA [Sphingopyxis sp. H057]KTE49938.1 chromosome partitioning protein ParA [Sphingopyxis sp. H071]KTE51166.1 chromosome partitioning protein ParA [Sphingopyxis sp. H073]KTE59021.1 chromosome partitioning protein ParA [Sphingopyxis sp. H107]KTE60618.1 chromosome partitioning protein ParA [Sphingopyxis sp. H100]
MNGRTIAVYSLKGGVGKTTLAVNLAWAAATLSSRRTLLWDLDGQAAATYILGHEGTGKKAQAAIRRDLDPAKLIAPTATDRLSLLPADRSLRGLDVEFHELDKKKRLAKIAGDFARGFERILIDCPPGLTDTSEQILRAADLVIVPVIPSPLARRALEAIEEHMGGRKALRVPLLPVFSMVDRRRALHRETLADAPDWPVIPMASAYERMTEARAPIGMLGGRKSAPVAAIAALWQTVEKRLAASAS